MCVYRMCGLTSRSCIGERLECLFFFGCFLLFLFLSMKRTFDLLLGVSSTNSTIKPCHEFLSVCDIGNRSECITVGLVVNTHVMSTYHEFQHPQNCGKLYNQ